jgi:molecular chaperone GrpE
MRTKEDMRQDERSKSLNTAGQDTQPGAQQGDTPDQQRHGEGIETSPISEPASPGETERLQAERDQLLDRLARLQAEFDNYRKREARDRAEFREYSVGNTVEQFLPVLDNFQLALRSQGTAEQLRSGVDLIVRQMEEIVRSLGVQPVPTVETPFDPRQHEAIEMVEREDVPDQQIIQEVRRGYKLRDRLLRPAMVRVASNPKQKTA